MPCGPPLFSRLLKRKRDDTGGPCALCYRGETPRADGIGRRLITVESRFVVEFGERIDSSNRGVDIGARIELRGGRQTIHVERVKARLGDAGRSEAEDVSTASVVRIFRNASERSLLDVTSTV